MKWRNGGLSNNISQIRQHVENPKSKFPQKYKEKVLNYLDKAEQAEDENTAWSYFRKALKWHGRGVIDTINQFKKSLQNREPRAPMKWDPKEFGSTINLVREIIGKSRIGVDMEHRGKALDYLDRAEQADDESSARSYLSEAFKEYFSNASPAFHEFQKRNLKKTIWKGMWDVFRRSLRKHYSAHRVRGMKWGEQDKELSDSINSLGLLARNPRITDEDRDRIKGHLDKAEQADDVASARKHFMDATMAYLQRRRRSVGRTLWDAMRSGFTKSYGLGIPSPVGRSRRLSLLLLVLVALMVLGPVLDRHLPRNRGWWYMTVLFAVLAFFYFSSWLRAWFERKLIKPEGNRPTAPPEARGISGGERDERPEFIEFAKGQGFKPVGHRPEDELGSYFKHSDGSRLNLYRNGTWTHYSPDGKKTEGKGIARLETQLG